jgi:hypothetical protein
VPKQFRVALYDEKGEIYTWDVALGVPSGFGWNLALRKGREGLIDDIVERMREVSSDANADDEDTAPGGWQGARR